MRYADAFKAKENAHKFSAVRGKVQKKNETKTNNNKNELAALATTEAAVIVCLISTAYMMFGSFKVAK